MEPDPLIGRTVGSYRIEEKLGEGGMGTVYRAVQTKLDRDVALKVLSPHLLRGDKDFVRRFFIEAKAAASLNHPNIVQVYDADEMDGQPFIAMEYVRGTDLKELLDHKGRFSEWLAVEFLDQAVQGLEAAAAEKIIHRDIKPANFMITEKGVVKVADFGLAKNLDVPSHLTQSGQVVGTPAYMSPEQAEGEKTVDLRSDIYSIGVTLFEMVTGRMPYEAGTPLGLLRLHCDAPVPDPLEVDPELNANLAAVISKMMAKSPDDRFQDYAEVLGALRAVRRDLEDAEDKGGGAGGHRSLVSDVSSVLEKVRVPAGETRLPGASPLTPATQAPPTHPQGQEKSSISPIVWVGGTALALGIAFVVFLILTGSRPAPAPEDGSPPPSPSPAVPVDTALLARAEELFKTAERSDLPEDWARAVEISAEAVSVRDDEESRGRLRSARGRHAFALARNARERGDLDEAVRLGLEAARCGAPVPDLAKHLWVWARMMESAEDYGKAVELAEEALKHANGPEGLETYLEGLRKKRVKWDLENERRRQYDALRRKAEAEEAGGPECDPHPALACWEEALEFADDSPERTKAETRIRILTERAVARAVRTYFRVMSKAEDPDALDEAIDWEGLRVRMAEQNPNFKMVTAEAVAKIFKDKFRAQTSKTKPEDGDMMVKILEIHVDGDEATGIVPPMGRDNPFLLVRKDGKWKIVRFPH